MNLDDLERQVIRDAQRELAPAPGVRERHEVELLSRLARGAPTASDTSGLRLMGALARGPAARGLGPFWGSPARMLGVGLALGALVGGVVGYSLGQRGSSVASATALPAGGARLQGESALAASSAPQGESVPEPSVPEPPVPEPPAPEPSAGPTVASTSSVGPGSGAAVRAAKPPARGTRTSEGNESSLAEELAMLQRARRALAADNGRLALGIVQELDERFPKGVLVEERGATRVLALCKLERVSEAREAARVFLARHPGSVYAERVRTSCVATPE